MKLKRALHSNGWSYFPVDWIPDLFSLYDVLIHVRGRGYLQMRGFFEYRDGSYYLVLPIDAEEVDVLYIDWVL